MSTAILTPRNGLINRDVLAKANKKPMARKLSYPELVKRRKEASKKKPK